MLFSMAQPPHQQLKEDKKTKKQQAAWLVVLALLFLVPDARGQDNKQQTQGGESIVTLPDADVQKNLQAYIALLRSDVRQQKAEVMGEVIQLSADDAAKFWPIYSAYDTELNKLSDQRVANIQEYAPTYSQMTDEKADRTDSESAGISQAVIRASCKIL
jgi:hypothetical protein